MPVRPPPLQCRCPHCGWHTLWQARSDALLPTDRPPERCPQCHRDDVEHQPASAAAALLARLNPWASRP